MLTLLRSKRKPALRDVVVVSGGQTGADQGGLDAAIKLGLPFGGWAPGGWINERRGIDAKYRWNGTNGLKELKGAGYPERTRMNVVDSDATIIFGLGSQIDGGSKLTKTICDELNKPSRVINLFNPPHPEDVRVWMDRNLVTVLNVAGSRESAALGIHDKTVEYLPEVLEGLRDPSKRR